jgi:flavin-dependent dehydrogenase
MMKASRLGELYTISDFSYRSKQCAGPGYVLIGDAFGFLDPVYSSGVYLALKSAELAAETIDEAIREGDLSAERLGAFGPRLTAGLESFRKLVYAFYTEGFSFSKFLASIRRCGPT